MFGTGTRVVVLSSSFSGKTGPKRGSIGYALDMKLGDSKKSGEGSYYDAERNWFITLHRIVFVRYGFENRQRGEAKFFINILPYISSQEALGVDTAELVDRRLGHVEMFDTTDEKFYDRIKYNVTSKFGKKYIHTGILVPVPINTSLIKTSTNDFGAWLECFMKDDRFHSLIMDMINNANKLTNIFDLNYLVMIKKMIDSKELRQDQVKLGTREGIVTTIRKVMTIGDRPRRQQIRKIEEQWLFKHGPDICASKKKQLTALRMVLDHLYAKDAAENLRIIQERTNGQAEIEKKVKYMKEIVSRMVSRARALEDGMKEKSQTVNHK